MDFITDLPPVKDGESVVDAILVIVDRVSKMAWSFATQKTIDAAMLARLFLTRFATKHGIPRGIVSDRGRTKY